MWGSSLVPSWALLRLVRCNLVYIDSRSRGRVRWTGARAVLRVAVILRGGDCCRYIEGILLVVVLMMVSGDNCIAVSVGAGLVRDLTDLLVEDVGWFGRDRKLVG